MDEQNLDYKAMFEGMLEKFTSFAELQHEYFQLMETVTKYRKESLAVAENIMKMSMADQVAYLRVTAKLYEMSEKFCDKYGFEVGEEQDD